MRKKPNIDFERIKEIDAKTAACFKAMRGADDATFEALTVHMDELVNERARALGLSEDEIARIERESSAAADEQIAAEIETFLQGSRR
jgi:hypothetical protein